MNTLVFDIETIPDLAHAKEMYNLALEDETELQAALSCLRKQEVGHDFLPLYLHKIVAISVVLKTPDRLHVYSLGDLESSEAELIKRFFDGIERYQPILVSWNGQGFDLPVLHYRALLHGVCAKQYWEAGEDNPNFRFNNYLNRFHYRHCDLMDVLAGYQGKANAPLEGIATLLKLPGKLGMHGSKVFEYYQAGKLDEIRDYCETDVLNTYLVYLRFQLIRGKLTESAYLSACQEVKDSLQKTPKKHFQEFLNAWEMKSNRSS